GDRCARGSLDSTARQRGARRREEVAIRADTGQRSARTGSDDDNHRLYIAAVASGDYSPGFSPGRSTISIRAPEGPATYEKLMVGPFGSGSGRGSLVTVTPLPLRPSIVSFSGPVDRQPM